MMMNAQPQVHPYPRKGSSAVVPGPSEGRAWLKQKEQRGALVATHGYGVEQSHLLQNLERQLAMACDSHTAR